MARGRIAVGLSPWASRTARFCRRWPLLCLGRLLFTVISCAHNSNRAAGITAIELGLLRFGVRRAVNCDAVLHELDHHDPQSHPRTWHGTRHVKRVQDSPRYGT